MSEPTQNPPPSRVTQTSTVNRLVRRGRRPVGVAVGLLGAGILMLAATGGVSAAEGEASGSASATRIAVTAGQPLAPAADLAIAGSDIQLVGADLAPGDDLDVLLDGELLGTVVVGDDGVLDTVVTIPASTLAGKHWIEIEGSAVSHRIEILAAAVDVASSTGTASTAGPAASSSSASSSSASSSAPATAESAAAGDTPTSASSTPYTTEPIATEPVATEPVATTAAPTTTSATENTESTESTESTQTLESAGNQARIAVAAAPQGAALALPPGGAASDTPGTSSTVDGSAAIGEQLSFTLSGYPAGETVYVKIDDGQYTGSGVVAGADIVATFPIPDSGSVSGTITVPADLAEGDHWLRFLASKVVDAGTLGYTHKSDTFTVTAAAAPTTSAGTTTTAPTTSAGTTTAAPTTTSGATTTGSTTSGGSTAGTTTGTSGSVAGTGATTSSGSDTGSGTASTTTTDSDGTGTAAGGDSAGSGGGGAGSGTSSGGGALASTGVDSGTALAIGAGLLLAGAGIAGPSRRRATS
ncbi:hypothetical protein GIS00_13215 [Nakamurella sp. YIM 132087]|uniref:LPXTG cell wall anchor domain-containing protein n=1 Tax=Nakamurella alba TaxID=2665158 RepID=A0A7K1FNL4_9ACTN|nr:hypothetical protein [Nakamurella alba]MTD14899.1 hypothetical protein [Nakamurella alba]